MFWIRIRPLIYLRDLNLNDGFDKVLKEPDQKDSVKSATVDMKYIFKKFYFYSNGSFFHGSGSGYLADPDPDSEKSKKSDPDPGKNPDPKHCP